MLPFNAHTAGVSTTNVTGKPDEAEAATVGACAPSVWSGTVAKVIVCAVPAIVMENACVALGETPFLALNEPTNVPIWLGVPLMTPVAAFSAKPVGKLPDVIENVGGGMPVASNA